MAASARVYILEGDRVDVQFKFGPVYELFLVHTGCWIVCIIASTSCRRSE